MWNSSITSPQAQTTAAGLVRAQGHRGRYAVTALPGALRAKATVELGGHTTELVLRLPQQTDAR